MPSIIETTVYCLDELPDAGKEKARAWYRESCLDYDWFDFVYEDFERVCAIVGVRLDTVQVRLIGGGTRQEPCIRFSGFWNQGDGACFEGRSEEHTSELQSLMRISYAVFCLKKKTQPKPK